LVRIWPSAVEKALLYVAQQHAQAGAGKDVRNARAHGACAYYGYGCDLRHRQFLLNEKV